MLNTSGIPHVRTRIPLPLWCAAVVVTIFSLSTTLTQRDSEQGVHQQANMASVFSSLLPL